jgi:hypothetical protein
MWGCTMEPNKSAGAVRRYEFRVLGLLSERARSAFHGMDIHEVPVETVICGEVAEDGGVQEVMDVLQMLGMRVVSVRRTSVERPSGRTPVTHRGE